ncbi:recombination-associated protein RdgC [Desulfobulbus alkaliphilus]|uniref:recombination-associated protein RdgC n=1 Tax=Desulfobulbus alkaliphilus TaxID=869814 RepID=UPI001962C16F|nr:recombination-associated protein RdgC [Desulfobulbus alkaliphilus]MBM9537278.1 recombination-associated protein RdgC [Desulfobulbus alkaliphilus]
MGLLTGSASIIRFSVVGDLPESFWDFAEERIAVHRFKDIDDTLDEFSIGWVSVADMFDTDFAYSSYAAGDYVVLTMRVDERKVSPSVLKKYVTKEEERIKREKQIPRLSRAARLEIKERIHAELIRKSLPVPSTYDLCWNLTDNTLLFFSTSKKAMALLEDLFKETFNLSLILQIPWLIGLQMAEGDSLDKYEEMRPAILL